MVGLLSPSSRAPPYTHKMAGQATKKAAKAQDQARNLYYPIIVAMNVIFLLFRVFNNFQSFGRRQAFLLVMTSLVYYICYHGLVASARDGISGAAYFDIFCVCVAGQFVTIFSDYYGMLVFLLQHAPASAEFSGVSSDAEEYESDKAIGYNLSSVTQSWESSLRGKYTAVPGYYSCKAGYWMLQQLGQWMRSQQLENSEGYSESDVKRQAKKERKAAKAPKIKMR